MSTTEAIIAVLVIAGVVGQFALITWARRRSMFRDNAKKRADLIEREYEKQIGDRR